MLELLQQDAFRRELVNPPCAKFIEEQLLLHWQFYSFRRQMAAAGAQPQAGAAAPVAAAAGATSTGPLAPAAAAPRAPTPAGLGAAPQGECAPGKPEDVMVCNRCQLFGATKLLRQLNLFVKT